MTYHCLIPRGLSCIQEALWPPTSKVCAKLDSIATMIKSLNLAFQDEKLGLVRLKFGLLKYWGLNSWITGFDWSLNCQACVLTWSDASCHMSSNRFILIRSAKKASWIKLDLDSRFNSRFKHVHLQPGKQVVSIATTQWFRYQRRDYAASRLRTVVFWGCEDQDKDSFFTPHFLLGRQPNHSQNT